MGVIVFWLFAVLFLLGCLILLCVAFVRTGGIGNLDLRLTGVEAALLRLTQQQAVAQQPPAEAAQSPAETPAIIVQPAGSDPAPTVEAHPPPLPNVSTPQEHLEVIIGQKWLGLITPALMLDAAVSSLQYAFANLRVG